MHHKEQEQLTMMNRGIATRIKNVVDAEYWVDPRFKILTFANPDNLLRRTYLRSGLVRQVKLSSGRSIDTMPGFPRNFSCPAYDLSVQYSGEEVLKQYVTSKYGPIPAYFLDPNNRLCSAINLLCFNLEGKTLKTESIHYVGNYYNPEFDRDQLEVVDFISEEDLRCVDLTPGDYEVVAQHLTQIETGKLVRIKP